MTAGRTVNTSSRDWGTPAKYVSAVLRVLGEIELDPCSNDYSLVESRKKYQLPTDGLKESWAFRTIYVNPPYGADRARGSSIRDWLRRCAEAHRAHRSEIIALIPVAPNTRHWKESVWGVARAVCFLADTRLRFLEQGEDRGKGAPMACAMVYWGENFARFRKVFNEYGAVVRVR